MPQYNGRSTHGAINQMARESGMTFKDISLKMGRSARYIDDIKHKGITSSASVMAEISKACGYDMRLVGHGQTIHIRPND